jgi:hypothetical protein
MMVFASLMLVVSSLVLFAYSLKQRDHQHADRLALLPLLDNPPSRRPDPALGPAEASSLTHTSVDRPR